jgi:DNA-binding IclR family transcriptional regulator
MIAVGVPITDKVGRFYSSLAIQAPVFRFSLDDAKRFVPQLRDAARDLSTLIEE